MNFIGVIDSGVGGLTVLQQLREKYSCNFIYVADHAFCPYGTKPNSVIFRRTCELIRYLKSLGAQAVVLACNTMSAFADRLQQLHSLPVFDVIAPTCQLISNDTRIKTVALLATKSTIANGAYQRLLNRHGIDVVGFDCSAFVPYVERNEIDSLQCRAVVEQALRNLPSTHAEAVVLGCTHFPLLRNLITEYTFGKIIIECLSTLPRELAHACPSPKVTYFTTGDSESAINAARVFQDVRFEHITL